MMKLPMAVVVTMLDAGGLHRVWHVQCSHEREWRRRLWTTQNPKRAGNNKAKDTANDDKKRHRRAVSGGGGRGGGGGGGG
jgi:hypothetical protein